MKCRSFDRDDTFTPQTKQFDAKNTVYEKRKTLVHLHLSNLINSIKCQNRIKLDFEQKVENMRHQQRERSSLLQRERSSLLKIRASIITRSFTI